MKELSLVTLMLCVSTAWSYTVSGTTYATNGLEEDVQQAINRATNGAIIVIQNGSYTWHKQLTSLQD
jgi:hypothetical protein